MEKEFFGRKLRRHFHRKNIILKAVEYKGTTIRAYGKEQRKKLMKLESKDWKALAKKHNRYFEGKNVPIGEPRKGGQPTRKEFEITNRKTVSLKNVFSREQQAAMIDDVVEGQCNEFGATDSENSDQEDGDNAADGDSDQGSDDEDDAVEEGYYKEESDDEDDGQRPASNTTGGIPVQVYRY